MENGLAPNRFRQRWLDWLLGTYLFFAVLLAMIVVPLVLGSATRSESFWLQDKGTDGHVLFASRESGSGI